MSRRIFKKGTAIVIAATMMMQGTATTLAQAPVDSNVKIQVSTEGKTETLIEGEEGSQEESGTETLVEGDQEERAEAPVEGDQEEITETPVEDTTIPAIELTEATPLAETKTEEPALQSGTIVLADGKDIKQALYDALVSNKDALGKDFDPQSLKWEYECEGKSSTGLAKNTAWGSIDGFTSETGSLIKIKYTHPSLADNQDGEYQIRLEGMDHAVTVTKKSHYDSSITLNEGVSVTIPVSEDGKTVDYHALRQSIFDEVVASTTPEDLTVNDVTIEYYTNDVTTISQGWAPLEGGLVGIRYYPAISAGEHPIKITYNGNAQYASTSAEVNVTITNRPTVTIEQKEGPYKAKIVYNNDSSYNYDAIKKNIFEAIVEKIEPTIAYHDPRVSIQYNSSYVGDTIPIYKDLDADVTDVEKKFGIGEHKIKITIADSKDLIGTELVADVTIEDGRETSKVALKDGVSISYNSDKQAMKQDIFNNVIDWENSSLPDKSQVSIDDFEFEYYTSSLLADGINTTIKDWVPLEGKDGVLGSNVGKFPAIQAGDQQIRVSFKGNATYAPCDAVEGKINVKKANLKVSVKFTNKFADETLTDYVTTNAPAGEEIQIYTVYGGLTSNVTAAVYLELPKQFTDTWVLKILDPIVKEITGKTFTDILNNGTTVGELRKIFADTTWIDTLEKFGIDTGVFGDILKTINKLPGILDSIRVGFGQPNRAGLYTATAIATSKNYNTGFGIGELLVKMRASGVKLVANTNIGSKITQEEAKNTDFNFTLCYGEEAVEDQSTVHYLYSGFTSKWKIYSSTTTPPTEPGRYVQTVVTLGGNYQAVPVTRSFQITK